MTAAADHRRPAAPEQRHFAAALLDPALPPPDGLASHHGAGLAARFAVYRNNVVHSLTGVLGDTFPVVRELVGADFFDAMARAFVRAQPPDSPLMHRYGHAFPAWLEGFEPAASLPYLPDVARLELARLRAWQAADADAVDAEVLAAALGDAGRLAATALVLHPSLAVVRSAHPVVALWSAHQADDAQRDVLLAGIDLGVGESALVLRLKDDALVLPLAEADAALADALASGHTLGAASLAHPDADLAGVLALLIRHGGIVGLSPPSTSLPPAANPEPTEPSA